jgi:hypothetical protein
MVDFGVDLGIEHSDFRKFGTIEIKFPPPTKKKLPSEHPICKNDQATSYLHHLASYWALEDRRSKLWVARELSKELEEARASYLKNPKVFDFFGVPSLFVSELQKSGIHSQNSDSALATLSTKEFLILIFEANLFAKVSPSKENLKKINQVGALFEDEYFTNLDTQAQVLKSLEKQ